MNPNTKIIFLIIGALLVAYLLYASQTQAPTLSTENFQDQLDQVDRVDRVDHFEPATGINTAIEQFTDTKQEVVMPPMNDYSPPEVSAINKKFASKNRAEEGMYKRSSYNEGKRGNLGPSDWQSFYDHNNNIIGASQSADNDKFLPNDESGSGFAVFRTTKQDSCGGNQDCSPEDLYDVQKYLPQEVNNDWFELVPEAISVKNRHLINITKPIGVNTIGSSKKNASWDLRGAPSCPKYVVSPFLNSSIEPDNNLKPL